MNLTVPGLIEAFKDLLRSGVHRGVFRRKHMSYEYFAVNKSSQTINNWDMTGRSIIDHLYQREAFGRKYVGSGYRQVRFRDGSGNVRDGLVFNTDYLPSSWETPCTSYPYGTVTLDGQTYYHRRWHCP